MCKIAVCRYCGDTFECDRFRSILGSVCIDCYLELFYNILPPAKHVFLRNVGGSNDPMLVSELQYSGDAMEALGYR